MGWQLCPLVQFVTALLAVVKAPETMLIIMIRAIVSLGLRVNTEASVLFLDVNVRGIRRVRHDVVYRPIQGGIVYLSVPIPAIWDIGCPDFVLPENRYTVCRHS